MAELTLSNQAAKSSGIQAKTDDLKASLLSRKEVWDRLPIEKKLNWAKSGKDPVMTLAYDNYLFLKTFFGEMDR